MKIFSHPLESASEQCALCGTRNLGICQLLDSSCGVRVAARSQPLSYTRSAEILAQGERADRIGIIRSGFVRIVLLTEDGDPQVLQILKPGQIVGDPCKTQNTFSWEAATAVSICWVQRSTLNTIMKDMPQVYKAFLDVIACQLEEHRLWAASMRRRNTLQRIAFWLMQQVPNLRDGATAAVEIALTRRDLASLLDMSVETLCRGLHQLCDRSAIRLLTPEKIEVLNIIKLRILARCSNGRMNDHLEARDPVITKENPFCFSVPSARTDQGVNAASRRPD
jgi:CRP/FNR family transcriptional regulator